jgi:hypothetical protein
MEGGPSQSLGALDREGATAPQHERRQKCQNDCLRDPGEKERFPVVGVPPITLLTPKPLLKSVPGEKKETEWYPDS